MSAKRICSMSGSEKVLFFKYIKLFFNNNIFGSLLNSVYTKTNEQSIIIVNGLVNIKLVFHAKSS